MVRVSWLSHNRFSPSHGKCGLAINMPPPSALPAEPIAQPLLPRVVVVSAGADSPVVSTVVLSVVAGAVAAGGCAVAIGPIRLPPLAYSVMSLRLAYRSVVVIGCTHSSPAHQPDAPSAASAALNPAT